MRIECSRSNPPLGGILAIELYKSYSKPIELVWGENNLITTSNSNKQTPYGTSNDLIRFLENAFNKTVSPLQKVTMNHWLSFSLILEDDLDNSIEYIDKTLGPNTYLFGETLSVSDLAVYSILHVSSTFKQLLAKYTPKNVLRWMKLIEAQPSVVKALGDIPSDVRNVLSKSNRKSPANGEAGSGRQQEGKFIELPHAEMGKVIVRFPPEASGFLHIGHAKAALLNQYYQEAFEGKLIMRFDDTNPAKENAEFEKVILEDVEMLEIKPDMFTHTSQYFDLMLQLCEKLIKENKAFVDDTPAEQMKAEREQKVDSRNKSNSIEKNLQLWDEMKKGSTIGIQCCVRAKIDMQSQNGCLRDPTIYRCKPETHPRTGNQYKVYPTYDFACPIVDSIEGVTHVLRTMEYHDRDPQFYWFIEALGLRKPYIWEYSRLSMTNTVLSKRKLTWFVEQGLVDGWDDPRMPTVRGVLRRGMTVEALRQFIHAQGSSRSVVFMQWDKIWAINKKVIDPIAPRYTTLEVKPVPVNLKGVSSDSNISVPLHPKNDVGSKTVWVSKTLWIDQYDAKMLKEGENTTFIYYGNVIIDKIHRSADGTIVKIDATPNLDNKDYKKTLKVTWLADSPQSPTVETYCVYFDHIISKPLLGKDEDFKQFIGHQTRWEIPMLGEPALASVKAGDIIQLQRRGFFKVDVAPTGPSEFTGKRTPLILFHVPDGHTKELPGQPKSSQATPAASKTSPQPQSSNALTATADEGSQINIEIAKQGDLVRLLKTSKADKQKVDEAVKALLQLKDKYKKATGQDWKPGVSPPAPTVTKQSQSSDGDKVADVLKKIAAQGDQVRKLKGEKAAKATVDVEVKNLLNLKAQYKALTGSDWTPNATAPTAAPAQTASAVKAEVASPNAAAAELDKKIAEQGNKVRSLKEQKADKAAVQTEVKNLLNLKTQYKALTGSDWTPNATAPTAAPAQTASAVKTEAASPNAAATELDKKIAEQGNKVRSLKEQKADKAAVQTEVKNLLNLKAQYKALTGSEWTPNANAPVAAQNATVIKSEVASSTNMAATELDKKIAEQGNKVRTLKEQKADKAAVQAEKTSETMEIIRRIIENIRRPTPPPAFSLAATMKAAK